MSSLITELEKELYDLDDKAKALRESISDLKLKIAKVDYENKDSVQPEADEDPADPGWKHGARVDLLNIEWVRLYCPDKEGCGCFYSYSASVLSGKKAIHCRECGKVWYVKKIVDVDAAEPKFMYREVPND